MVKAYIVGVIGAILIAIYLYFGYQNTKIQDLKRNISNSKIETKVKIFETKVKIKKEKYHEANTSIDLSIGTHSIRL